MAVMFQNHPKYEELKMFNVDEDQLQLALLVYLDLSESKGWWNIGFHVCPTLERVVVCGHPSQVDPRHAVLPVSSDVKLSLASLQEYIQAVTDTAQCQGVTLGFVSEDSSIVYYKISQDLVPPASPDEVEAKKSKRERKYQRRHMRYVKHSVAREIQKEADTLHVQDDVDIASDAGSNEIVSEPAVTEHCQPTATDYQPTSSEHCQTTATDYQPTSSEHCQPTATDYQPTSSEHCQTTATDYQPTSSEHCQPTATDYQPTSSEHCQLTSHSTSMEHFQPTSAESKPAAMDHLYQNITLDDMTVINPTSVSNISP